RRHTRLQGDWSSDVCSSDLVALTQNGGSTGAVAATPAPGSGASPNGRHGVTRDQYLNDLANNLGIDRAKLDAALKQTSLQEVDEIGRASCRERVERWVREVY